MTTHNALDVVAPVAEMAGRRPEVGEGSADLGQASLATMLPGAGERRLALTVAVSSTVIFVLAVPFAQVPLARVPAFIPIYESVLVVNDLVTSLLLFGQSVQQRSRGLVVLAAGYLFDGLVIVPHALTFPGLFAPDGLLGAGSQSTAWLYMFWHGGFPLFVIGYAVLETRGRASPPSPRSYPGARGMAGVVAAVAGVVVAMTLLATAESGVLPAIMDGHGYTPAMKVVVGSVWALSLAALVVLWSRRPCSVLDLWLMVVLCAWLFDIALSAVLNAGRFDLGFYAGRLYGLLAATFVLVVLLLETSGLYSRLVHANAALQGRARRLAGDVQETVAAHRRTEEQLRQAQKMEVVGNLTGGIAHDFNNLLGILIGNLDLIRDRVEGDPQTLELVDAALEAGLRGADLNRRLLAFARRQTLQPEEVDVNAAIAGMVKLLRHSLGERVEIKLACGAGIWPVKVDPVQLETTVVNLAVNARDAMPHGGKLLIETHNVSLDAAYADRHEELLSGDYVMVAVSDTGVGMAPGVLERVFEPFFTTKAVGQGTGLGLSMVYGFLKQSGGHVNIYSEAGRGTTVRLYFPRLPTPGEGRAAASSAGPAPVTAHGEVVLLVEDNAEMRRVAARQLVELGYRVEEAENGERALELVDKGLRPDLLFTDVTMPGSLDGVELAERLCARIPGLSVLLSSGFTERAILGSRLQDRRMAHNLLAKPYRKTQLAQALRHAIERLDDKEGTS